MDKKFRLTNETKDVNSIFGHKTVYRIQALRDFGCVKKGECGGFVEKEENLSHENTCWIYDDAIVLHKAKIKDKARIMHHAKISGNAIIYDNATVRDFAEVTSAEVFGCASIEDYAAVCDDSKVFGYAVICDDSEVFHNALVYGNAKVRGGKIKDDAEVFGAITIRANTVISKGGYIRNYLDFLIVGPLGSRYSYTTFYRTKNRDIFVSCGCFNGSIDEFTERVIRVHGDNSYAKEYLLAINFAKEKFNLYKDEGVKNEG